MSANPSADSPAASDSLRSRSYVGLLLTQFLGGFNDNLFRWLAVPLAQREMDAAAALTWGGVCFTVPYLLLTPTAGSLADRYSKRSVIVACKVAEIAIMLAGVAAIASGQPILLFGVVTLLGAQSALFAPSKFGSLPELLSPSALSKGNGVMGLATIVSAAAGTVAGFQLYGLMEASSAMEGLSAAWPAAVATLGIAAVGWLASLLIGRVPAANPGQPLQFNPVTETLPALRHLWSDVRIFRTSLGIAFFWMLASLSQLNIDPFGETILGLAKEDIGLLLALLVAGVGAGSVLAGVWSGGKVELGIVPLGALGIAISSLLVFVAGSRMEAGVPALSQGAFYGACVALFFLGVSAGLFDVPLEAYLQHRSDPRNRGKILAGSNFVAFSFILLACGLFYVCQNVLRLTAGEIFIVAGLGTLPVVVYVFRLLPQATIRFLMWLATHSVYRVRVAGRNNIPDQGGALIVANHVSWMDGLLMLTSTTRSVRFLVYADYANKRIVRWLAELFNVIPVKATAGPKAIVAALQTAREAIRQGEVVCIFAEGQISRTGQLQPFQRGLLKIVQGTSAPVVPAYLHGLWGSIFSFHGGRFLWKWPRKWPYPVTILFGTPMPEPDNVNAVRQAVELLGVEAAKMDQSRQLIPVRKFIRQSKASRGRAKVADSSGLELQGGKLLAATLAMKRVIERTVLAPDEKTVGVLLPPSVGGAIANISLALAKRVSANLNYTMPDDVINFCVKDAGIRHVLTSRRFLEKKPCDLQGAEFVFLEDLKERVTGLDKAAAALGAFVLPAAVLERQLGLLEIRGEELLSIIFTSGSTGEPKGVMLSHANIGSNVDAVDQMLHLKDDDVLMGVLPFFHSFGYTATLWLPLCYAPKAVYHFNPLDARVIGKLSEQHRTTILMATPTFLKTYLKRIEPEQLQALDMVVTGAEKLPLDLGEAFRAKFGIFPTEGYGTTELSPVAAVNIPDHRSSMAHQKGTKHGTVGRALPNVCAKIVDPDTGADRGINVEGLLKIKGPNVMLGYLHQAEKTAAVIQDGWYNTGDYAKIDEEGFITITGRQSRFSKIGGEMVPHILIEEEIARIVESPDEDEPEVKVAVTALPDPDKGERLIVLHKPLSMPIDQIRRELSNRGLPNLWIPGNDGFVEVAQIPLLGTGKLDLRGIKQLAMELSSQARATA